MEAAAQPWPALGVLLLRDGLVTKEQLEAVLDDQTDGRQQRISGRRLGELLVERGIVTEKQVAEHVAEQYELPFADLAVADIDLRVAVLLEESLARRFSAVTVSARPDGSYLLAIAEPSTVLFSDELRRALGGQPTFVVVGPAAIDAAIDFVYAQQGSGTEPPPEAPTETGVIVELPGSAETTPRANGSDESLLWSHRSAAHYWPPLGALLIREGLVTDADIEAALAQQRLSASRRLGEILVDRGAVTPADIARLVAEQYELPFLDLAEVEIDSSAAALLPEEVARRRSALPVERLPDGSLRLVVADPTNVLHSDELRLALGVSLSFSVAAPEQIEAAIRSIHDRAPAQVQDTDVAVPAVDEPLGSTSSTVAHDDEESSVVNDPSQAGVTDLFVDSVDLPVGDPPAVDLLEDEPFEHPWFAAMPDEEHPAETPDLPTDEVQRDEELLAEVEETAAAEAEPAQPEHVDEPLAEAPVLQTDDVQLDEEHLAEVEETAAAEAAHFDEPEHSDEPLAEAPVLETDDVQLDEEHLAEVEETAAAEAEPAQPEHVDEPLAEAPVLQTDDVQLDEEHLAEVEETAAAEAAHFDEPEHSDEPLAEAPVLETDDVQLDEEHLAEVEETAAAEAEPAQPEHADEPLAEAPVLETDDVQLDEEHLAEVEETAAAEAEPAQPEHVDEPFAEAPEPGTDEVQLDEELLAEVEETVAVAVAAPGGSETEQPEATDDDALLAEELHEAIWRALSLGATSIQLTPQPQALVVRARVDRAMRELATFPTASGHTATKRLAELAGIDPSARAPRRGLLAVTDDGRTVDLQVATLPTKLGLQLSLRVADGIGSREGLSELGLRPEPEAALREALRKPFGVVLVCGPALSGRTTTLYAALHELATPERALSTIEDPVDRLVSGIDQVDVDPAAGVTFAAGLRAILRSGADTVLVGDLRDAETAQVAFRGARGHRLVLAALDAPTATSAIGRLTEDLGVESHLVASTSSCLVAQHLVQRICPDCRETYYASAEEIAELGRPDDESGRRLLARGRGCSSCGGAGYDGWAGVFEVLPLTDEVRALVDQRAAPSTVREAAIAAGMSTLRDEAVGLCLDGITTVSEVRQLPRD